MQRTTLRAAIDAGRYAERGQCMPFTPFHMGAALLLKPALRLRFSVLVFGASQVAIDLEPLVRMLRGDEVLHGWTHTVLGAFVIGAASAWIARPIANLWLALLRRDGVAHTFASSITPRVALLSAWIGTGSHVLLDSIMHADMHPLAPLSARNPLLGAVSLSTLHFALVAAGAVGLLGLALLGRNTSDGPP